MPSPADLRRRAERVLRAIAIAATVVLIARALATPGDSGSAVVTATELDSALARWTLSPPGAVHLRADVAPAATARDWLLALRRTGTAVSWTVRDTSPAALVVEPVAAPGAVARLVAVGTPGRSVVAADAAGAIDSLVIGDAHALALRRNTTGLVEAAIGAVRATAMRRDSLFVRPVLVVGTAGWESKFAVAALEEDGWIVRARLAVAPGATVQQGGAVPLDTGAISAVIVLDSAAVPGIDALRRFVQNGGGLVVLGSALGARSLAALLPARATGRVAGIPGALTGAQPRTGLTVRTLEPTTPQAVPLELRGSAPVVVAARSGTGRIVAAGYEDTWRWRMLGGDDAVEAHRAWWTALVSSVAHAPAVAAAHAVADDVATTVSRRRWALAAQLDEAPLAATVAALGPPSSTAASDAAPARRWLDTLLFALLLVSLSAEWWSRRLRGVP